MAKRKPNQSNPMIIKVPIYVDVDAKLHSEDVSAFVDLLNDEFTEILRRRKLGHIIKEVRQALDIKRGTYKLITKEMALESLRTAR